MNADAQAMGGIPLPTKRRKGYWTYFGGKFLVLSIVAHLLFFTGAAYYIIQVVVPRKLTFKAGAPSTNPVKDVAEHKMSMAKKAKSMSAPAPAKRVVTTGLAKIALPPMPEMPTNVVSPTQIAGIGGVGMGFGTGQGGTGAGGGGGNGYMAPFGTTNARPGMLKGTFYDLKFLRGGKDAPDVGKDYSADITHYVMNGWHDGELSKYLKGPTPLYTTQIFFPVIDTNDAPKAFKSPKPDSPGKWIAIYKGDVSPPDSGTYHFVAAGDDDMIIRFNNQTVLFHCEHIEAPPELKGEEYRYDGERLSYARSLPMAVEAGKTYPIEILIGDDIPREMFAKVLIEKEGVEYQHDGGGGPILPVFAVAQVEVSGTETPAHLTTPVWQGKASTSLMDMFDDQH